MTEKCAKKQTCFGDESAVSPLQRISRRFRFIYACGEF